MSAWNPDLYQRGIVFAAEAHRDQCVPGTTLPYLVHVSNVCMEVMGGLQHEAVDRPDLAIQCALLHDVLEDTATTLEELSGRFGAQVAAGVSALTKNPDLEKGERMKDSLARQCLQPPEVQLVKLADRITNLQQPPGDWSTEKRRRYREEAKLIHEKLKGSHSVLAERLLCKIDEYDRYLSSDS